MSEKLKKNFDYFDMWHLIDPNVSLLRKKLKDLGMNPVEEAEEWHTVYESPNE
jgi:hypothetical protein